MSDCCPMLHPYGAEDAFEFIGDGVEVVYVQGAVDVFAYRLLHRPELPAVFGVPGLEAWRPEWAAYARGRAAVIAFDADEAGDRAAERVARDLYAAGAASVTRSRPSAAKNWAELIAQKYERYPHLETRVAEIERERDRYIAENRKLWARLHMVSDVISGEKDDEL